MSKYQFHFDFDGKGDPPHVYIWEDGAGDIIEILEEPTSPLGKLVGDVHLVWEGEFSFEDEDWEPGPLAQKIMKFLQGTEGDDL